MNVIQAYLKYNKQFVILISGLSGSGKSELAKLMINDFKFKLINLNDYYKKHYNKIVTLKKKDDNNLQIVDWDDINAINWDLFNDDITKYINEKIGLIIVGSIFPTEQLKFTQDIHYHIKISKQTLFERRHIFLDKHKKDIEPILYDIKDTETEQLIFDKITEPHYKEYLEKSKVSKFVNANINTIDQIYDIVFEHVIDFVQKYLEKR